MSKVNLRFANLEIEARPRHWTSRPRRGETFQKSNSRLSRGETAVSRTTSLCVCMYVCLYVRGTYQVNDECYPRCLAHFGIFPANPVDAVGRLRFHSDNPLRILSGDQSLTPYYHINMSGLVFGNVR